MKQFAYNRTRALEEAVMEMRAGAAPAAGTTELLNWMRLGISSPDTLIDITRIDDLRGIALNGNVLTVGALSTLNEVGMSDAVRANAPVLSEAALKAASAQIRNRATIGGNVLQKNRCPYFRAEAATADRMPWPCNKRVAGSGCSAVEGHYTRAGMFGTTSECIATQPSDPVVALAALDAVADVLGAEGRREIPMRDFHFTQSEAPDIDTETRLRPGEIIVRYRIPVDAASRNSTYLKVRERESYEYAMVSAAVCLDAPNGLVRSARVALGSVAQKPWRLPQAEAALVGQRVDEGSLQGVFDAAMRDARPKRGQEWKPRLAANTATRATLIAGGTA